MIDISEFPQRHPGRKDSDDKSDRTQTTIDVSNPVFRGSYSHRLERLVLKQLRKLNDKNKQKLSGEKSDVNTKPSTHDIGGTDPKANRAKSPAQRTLTPMSRSAITPDTEMKVKRLLDELLTRQKENKKKRVKLPVDLSGTGGTFPPEKVSDPNTRLVECQNMLRLISDFERNEIEKKSKLIVRVVKEGHRAQQHLARLMKEHRKALVELENKKVVLVDEGLISFAGGLATGIVKAGASEFARGMGATPLGNIAGKAIRSAMKPATKTGKPLRSITNKVPKKKKQPKINMQTGKEFGKSLPSDFGLRTGSDASRDKRMGMVRGGLQGG